jgi:hypothetical protein
MLPEPSRLEEENEVDLSGSEPDRKALNEALLRERNEALEPYNAATHWVDPPVADWHCECAMPECSQPVQLTITEYEAVRGNPRRFVIVADERHFRPEAERVVVQTDRYWVVEKVGEAAELAEALDPRSSSGLGS